VAARAGKGTALANDTPSHEPATADFSFLPGPVLLLGAPGVGKGTQAQVLVAEFGVPQISTGDLFRENIRQQTPIGVQAKGLLDRGELVSDDVVNQMVAERLTHPDTHRGYLLDGFPRTLPQATWLDALLNGQQGTLPVVAVSILVPYEQLKLRITGRYTCPVCKSIYNIHSNPPRVAGHCDLDNAVLEQRSDDSEEVFADRMKTFDELTAPVIAHYRELGRFKEVDGEASVAEVTAKIIAALHYLREVRLAT
jgi:adenylate kinase